PERPPWPTASPSPPFPPRLPSLPPPPPPPTSAPSATPSCASHRPEGAWPAPEVVKVLAAERVPATVASPQTAKITGRDPVRESEPPEVMESPLTARTTASTPPLWVIASWTGAGCPLHQKDPPSVESKKALAQPMVSAGPIPCAATAAGSKLLGR